MRRFMMPESRAARVHVRVGMPSRKKKRETEYKNGTRFLDYVPFQRTESIALLVRNVISFWVCASPSIHNNHIIILTISYKSWYLKNKMRKRMKLAMIRTTAVIPQTRTDFSPHFLFFPFFSNLILFDYFFFLSVRFICQKVFFRNYEHNFGEWDDIVRACGL